MTEKEKFLAWEKDQRENHGLVDLHISVNPELTHIDEEEYYKELNHWNEQLDNKNIQPRIYVCLKDEEVYKELNEMNKAFDEAKQLRHKWRRFQYNKNLSQNSHRKNLKFNQLQHYANS